MCCVNRNYQDYDNGKDSTGLLAVVYMYKQKQTQWNNIRYMKPTNQLLIKTRYPKSEPTYRRQVTNPRHQTPQGQPVAKPITRL